MPAGENGRKSEEGVGQATSASKATSASDSSASPVIRFRPLFIPLSPASSPLGSPASFRSPVGSPTISQASLLSAVGFSKRLSSPSSSSDELKSDLSSSSEDESEEVLTKHVSDADDDRHEKLKAMCRQKLTLAYFAETATDDSQKRTRIQLQKATADYRQADKVLDQRLDHLVWQQTQPGHAPSLTQKAVM